VEIETKISLLKVLEQMREEEAFFFPLKILKKLEPCS
jgi:hypothetical protein